MLDFSNASYAEMVDILFSGTSKQQVDTYYHRLFPPLLKQQPDRDKLRKIVKAFLLKHAYHDDLPPSKVKILFSKLLGIKQNEIRDDHDEVIAHDANMTICMQRAAATSNRIVLDEACR